MIVDMNGVTGIANPLCPNKTIHQCLPDGEVDLKIKTRKITQTWGTKMQKFDH